MSYFILTLQGYKTIISGETTFPRFFKKDLALARLIPTTQHEQLILVQRVLSDNLAYIVALYRYGCYFYGDSPFFILATGFLSMLRSCNLFGNDFTQRSAELLFIEANVKNVSTGEDTVHQMVLIEFIGAIVRLAHAKYSSLSLSDALLELIGTNITPFIQPVSVASCIVLTT